MIEVRLVFLLILLCSCTIISEVDTVFDSPRLPGPDSCPSGVVCRSDFLHLGSFNIQTFGRSKRSKSDVMKSIVDIVSDFNLVGIQEIRDSSLETVPFLLSALNKTNISYNAVVSPRLGRSSSKEQYAFLFDDSVSYKNVSFVYNDTFDFFERPPFGALFEINNFDFFVVNFHIRPDDAVSEISHVDDVVDFIIDTYNEKDIVFLGDFNADGSYFDESNLISGALSSSIPNDFDTTVSSSDNTYDRILVSDGFPVVSSGVYRFDTIQGLDYEETKRVSDHYPVYVLLEIA